MQSIVAGSVLDVQYLYVKKIPKKYKVIFFLLECRDIIGEVCQFGLFYAADGTYLEGCTEKSIADPGGVIHTPAGGPHCPVRTVETQLLYQWNHVHYRPCGENCPMDIGLSKGLLD